MKGLLYKEFYLSKKTYIIFGGLVILFTIMGFLVCLSMICGNLQELAKDTEAKTYFATIFTYLPYVLMLLAAAGSNQSIFGDYESHWMYYSYTHPTLPVKAVGVRYLTGLIIFAVSFVYGTINAWVISAMTDISLNAAVFKNMLTILVVAVMVYSLLIPLALKYKTANAVATRCVIVLVVLYIALGGYMMHVFNMFPDDGEAQERYMEEMSENMLSIRDMLLPFTPVIMAVCLVISVWFSMKIYQRREV